MAKKVLPLKEVSIEELFSGSEKSTYEIPIYQRNYAWENDEIRALVQDVYDAYKKDAGRPYYIRFTTDRMTAVLPDAQDAKSGWGTKNHYFYEFNNHAGKKINLQFALSGKNIPDDLRQICDRINEFCPAKRNIVNWQWRLPFSTPRARITEEMADEEIIEIISRQYNELKQFESSLTYAMSGEA